MAIKNIIPIGYSATQADIDSGLFNAKTGGYIMVVDANGADTGKRYEVGASGSVPIEAGGIKNNLAATTAPLVTDDGSKGYSIGSRFIDTTGDESYICLDATVGSALWSKTTVGTISEVANLQSSLDAKEPKVTGKGLSEVDFTTAKDTKLSGIATGATANDTDVNLKARANHTGTQAQSTVDNLTTDLGLKAPIASPAFTGTPTGITKTHVGLANVDNTTDLNKAVSTAQQTALDGKQATLASGTNIKTVNGVTLLGSGNITTSADLAGGTDTTITNEGLVSTGADSVDITTIPGQTIIRYIATTGTAFTAPLNVTNVRVLAVAGGGAGSAHTSGGGGAGGFIEQTSQPVTPGTPVTVTVGAGGVSVAGAKSNNGGNSVFSALTAIGGGAGGWSSGDNNGNIGGSGGGATVSGAPGTGTTDQGFAGGTITSWSGVFGATGGGGAGGVGGNQSATAAGNGGVGRQSDITGTNTFYAGGGAGGANTVSAAGTGGQGGGGDGSNPAGESNDGVANTGGGGGGQSNDNGTRGGHGGSGVVIVRFSTQTRTYQALQSFADNASAIAGGRRVGEFFKLTSTGAVQQVA